jgi:putative DNA primase/helicase
MTKRCTARNLKKTTEALTDATSGSVLNEQNSGLRAISSPEVDSSNCSVITINADTIPSELKKHNQSVMWKEETRHGKPTKVPYTVDNCPAKADDPTTWNSFEACLKALNSNGNYHFTGIGFEFSKTIGITGIDIDHCRNPETGEIEKWAAEKVRQFDTYAEVSPSGEGLHIFVKGVKRGKRSKRGNVELYDSGRFFTLTGAHLSGTPFTIESRQDELDAFYAEVFENDEAEKNGLPRAITRSRDSALLAKATSAKNGKKFERLYYEGDTSNYPSASEADLALCSELAFWTDGDQEQIDRLFRGSALFRSKWDEQHGARTYGQMTIEKACDGLKDGYLSDTYYGSPSEQFFVGSRFAPKRVADVILSRYHFFTFTDTEEVYVYNADEGIYEPGGEQIIRDETQRLLGDRTTNHYVSEVEGYIRRSRYLKRELLAQTPDLIPVQNGVLNRETRTLEPYTPAKPFVSKIPVLYDAEAEGAAFKEFLNETFRPEDIPLAEEILGDVLYRNYWHKKGVMLLGPGDNGKSVFFYVEGSLLGPENIATRSLQDIDRDRFAKADLFGKYANIYADIPNAALRTTGTFKMLTGGDRINAERKYQQPFTFVNFAKLHFSANELPFTKDQTPAFFNRWLLIELPYRFVDDPRSDGEKKRDPHLLKKLTTDEELSGVLNVALDGLDRLLANGQFTKSEASEGVKERWIARTDSLQSFTEKRVSLKKGCFVSKDQFYGAYQDYCDEQDLNAVEKSVVGKRLPTIITTISFRPQPDGKRPTAWRDISVEGVEERQYSSHRQVATDTDQVPHSRYVKDVKANFTIPCICEAEIQETSTHSKPEEELKNYLDARDVSAASAPIADAPADYLCALVLERLRLRASNNIRSTTVDELMVQTVKDVQTDHHDFDPAEIAAAFRVVQRSDEGQQLIKDLVPQANALADDGRAGAKRTEGTTE